ncbi:MAG: TlpA disulfide reductase family protein, partial [Actinomycetota bacterium]|nr:TlpA disulfide reductase family protein [Actinomycetota bacterium]
ATLRIDAQLADRAEGLIAAVVEVDPTEPTVETVVAPTTGGGNSETPHATIAGDALPAFDGTAGTDPAVGLPAPTVDGFDYDGNEIRIDPTEGPHLVMFQVHWCPHCAANLPDIQQWMADGTIPDWLQVTLVSTAETPDGDNYPAEQWLQELGWTGRVLEDAPQGTSGAAGSAGVAYGATGWPYFVVIGVDGNVLARASGELSVADMEELLAGLPDAP